MARNFSELRGRMSPERRQRSEAMADDMSVQVLRDAVKSRVPSGGSIDDLSIRELRDVVEGLGGQMAVTARLSRGREIELFPTFE
jgi:hypothetical protein